MTTQVTESPTIVTDNMKNITTANTHEPPLASETDGVITTAASATTAKMDHNNDDHGLRVGSFSFYMVIGAVSSITVVILTAVVMLIIYVTFHMRSKTLTFSPSSGRIPRQRQRRTSSSNIEEVVRSFDISILPDAGLDSEENSPLGLPVLLPLNDSKVNSPLRSISPALTPLSEKACRDRSLPPRKCDQIPIYIFLGPKESDPPFPKSPVECKQNLAYMHLGPEESSTAAPLQLKHNITCKQNAAYIHLDPEA